MTATGPPPLSSAEETHASHEVMELVRSDLDLSLLVIQLREVGKSWREVKAAIEATISRRAPQVPPCGLQIGRPNAQTPLCTAQCRVHRFGRGRLCAAGGVGAAPVADRTGEADVPDYPARASGKKKPQGSRSLSWT